MLAAVNAAFRATCGGGLAASVDRRCARRLPKLRPGRRNAAQPDKETFRSPLRRQRRSIRQFPGRIGTFLSGAASLPGRWIGSGRISARWCLAQARQPRHMRLDRPLPFLTPSGGSPALTPYRSMTPAVDTAKKGIDGGGPVTEADFPRLDSHRSGFDGIWFCGGTIRSVPAATPGHRTHSVSPCLRAVIVVRHCADAIGGACAAPLRLASSSTDPRTGAGRPHAYSPVDAGGFDRLVPGISWTGDGELSGFRAQLCEPTF